MKDFEIKLSEKDKQEVQANKKQEKEYKLAGNTRHQNGHTLFEYNTLTKEVCKASFKKMDAIIDLGEKMNLKKPKKENPFLSPHYQMNAPDDKPILNVVIKADCIYREALNFNNLVKRLERELGKDVVVINKI